MTAFVIRRLLQSAVVVFVMSLIVFFGVNVVGDPVDMLINPEADQEDIERAIRALGLDRPIGEQYFYFVKGALSGDFGRSFIFGVPALKLVLQRMPAADQVCLRYFVKAVEVAPDETDPAIVGGFRPVVG